jgi:hypothetical protein
MLGWVRKEYPHVKYASFSNDVLVDGDLSFWKA